MKRWETITLAMFVSVTLVVLVGGCGGGGGGGGGDSVTPPGTNLIGTYELLGFDVDYYDYDTLDYLFSLDEGDVSSFSGEWIISSNTMSQTINLEGDISSISENYSITYTNGTSVGVFHLPGYDIGFACSGNQITTYGEFCSLALGYCWGEWDYWTKTSDSTSLSLEKLSINDDEKNDIGGLIGPKFQ